MNANDFSMAMGQIDDRYLEEALSYKPERKIIPLYKKLTACAAVLVLILGSVIMMGTARRNAPVVYNEGRVITGREAPLSGIARCSLPESEIQPVYAQLKVETVEKTVISVSSGLVGVVTDGGQSDSSDTVTIEGDSLIFWNIDDALISSDFFMTLKTEKSEKRLTLKFSNEKNSWVIYKD